MERESKSRPQLAQLIREALIRQRGCKDVEVIFTHPERSPATNGANWNAVIRVRENDRANLIKMDCQGHAREIVQRLQAQYDLVSRRS